MASESVSTLVLLAHAWNGAMKNDAAWFVVLVPLFAAYQLGWKAAVAWTVAPTFALVVLPIIAIDFKPSAEWLLTQQEIDRNRVLLLWLVSILAVASARSLRLEIVKTVQQKEQIEEFNARLNEANGTLAQRNADIQLFSSAASHDLKAPLRRARGLLAIVNEELQRGCRRRRRFG